jgi:uracil-DNA glycosylase
MPYSEDAEALALTLKALYGDLGDLPILNKGVPRTTGPMPSESLAGFREKIRYCQECVLHVGRGQLVFGRGMAEAKIAFVGDFPSLGDDSRGEPFSDEAGALLHKMIVAMRLKPEEAYLTNLFKCRPPSGQKPDQDLARVCGTHLESQFRWLSARFIVALGEQSSRLLCRSEAPLAVLRKQMFQWNGRSVFCTFHPRDLLTEPARKKDAWLDLQAVMRALETE